MTSEPLAVVALMVAISTAIGFAILLNVDSSRIKRLQRDVACLKHPTSMASSIGPVRIRNGKVIAGRTTPSVTVCP